MFRNCQKSLVAEKTQTSPYQPPHAPSAPQHLAVTTVDRQNAPPPSSADLTSERWVPIFRAVPMKEEEMSRPNAVLTMARAAAERNAIDLLAYSSTIFPDGAKDLVSVKLIEIGVAFAVNARRCFEVDGQPVEITAKRWNYTMNETKIVETDLWRALNGIIHARKLRIHFVTAPHGVFEAQGNALALHFIYETDRYSETYVDLFGLAWTFLSFGPFAWETTGIHPTRLSS